jgi:hypothetical protein
LKLIIINVFLGIVLTYFFKIGCCIGILFGLFGIVTALLWATICCFVHHSKTVDLTGLSLPTNGTIRVEMNENSLSPSVEEKGLLKNIDATDMV